MKDRILANLPRYVRELQDFASIPSVSTDGAAIDAAAEWILAALRDRGADVRGHPPRGNPIVVGTISSVGPTGLLYNHYDVQPPGPLDIWPSPPFEPVLKNGFVFARGATDNKGQILSHILGAQEQLERAGDLPVTLHFVIEGEEEIGSGNLGNFLSQNRAALKCDVALVSDTGMVARGVPTLSYGLRGVAALELKVTGPKIDLHSGI